MADLAVLLGKTLTDLIRRKLQNVREMLSMISRRTDVVGDTHAVRSADSGAATFLVVVGIAELVAAAFLFLKGF